MQRRRRHVDVSGAKIRFEFKGKSGQLNETEVTDHRLARIVEHCADIPGYELFKYVDADGQHIDVGSGDVNDYLREITGRDFTAKDFRTWAGTLYTALELERLGVCAKKNRVKRNVIDAIKTTAGRLHNRPATCRKYYVHPAVLRAYEGGVVLQQLCRARAKTNAARPRRTPQLNGAWPAPANSDYALDPKEEALLVLLNRFSSSNSGPELANTLAASLRRRRRQR